ncbi:MAG: glycosyltransferase family 4 protein [Rhodothermales bacterium]|nr:glycosyltransferase family 4 protein [Rhodothermales bacterium]
MTQSRARICILTETFFPVVGGGETQALDLGNNLAERGHSVIVVTRRSDATHEKRGKVGELLVFRVTPSGTGRRKKWGLLLTVIPALIRLRDRYDVILVSGYRIIGLTAVAIGMRLGKKILLKADSLGEMSGEFFRRGLGTVRLSTKNRAFRFFINTRNRILRRADGMVSISSAVRDELLEAHIRPEMIHDIPNGVDTTRFTPVSDPVKARLRDRLGLDQHAQIGVYTGRLVSYKGLALLLRVWREVVDEFSNAKLLLVGSGGLDMHNCEDELRSYVANHGLQNHVSFSGSVRNVEEYLQASDLFVFPTESEAFGLSLVEAMACGLPVITTTVGGVRDIVRHMEDGLMIKPADSHALLAGIRKLLDDPDLRTRLGSAACRTARERFSSVRVADLYSSLIETLASSGQPVGNATGSISEK